MRLDTIRPHHFCRSGSPDPDPFGSRHSRTTEVFVLIGRSRGTGPRATVRRSPFKHRRAGACPPPCVWIPSNLITPVGQDRRILTRSGAGTPELQRCSFDREIARDRPSRYGRRRDLPVSMRSRGTGPRATDRGEIARDRPSRYGPRDAPRDAPNQFPHSPPSSITPNRP